jgi:hypothetical protein
VAARALAVFIHAHTLCKLCLFVRHCSVPKMSVSCRLPHPCYFQAACTQYFVTIVCPASSLTLVSQALTMQGYFVTLGVLG